MTGGRDVVVEQTCRARIGSYFSLREWRRLVSALARLVSARDGAREVRRGMAPPLRWCLVMSDTRAAQGLDHYWQLTTAINRHYARAHGYGFLLAKLGWENHSGASPKLMSACAHARHGQRASPWCKIPVVAHVARHGVLGRRCLNLMYLDSDAYVANLSTSIDHFLVHARLSLIHI